MKNFLSPSEITSATIETGIKKANLSPVKTVLLAILGGIFIGFGAQADITIMQTFRHIDVGLMKFLGAAVFPVGIILVLIAGGELFTGNNLMTLALANRKITFSSLLRNWTLVYAGNFIGAILIAYALFISGIYKPEDEASKLAIGIATSKMSLTFIEAFIRGTLANILVVLAVWIAYGANDITSKIIGMWFPVMTFVMVGFEHSIANMFFIPLAKLLGYQITWSEIMLNNLLPVTLGNVFGGAIIVPLVYYIAYVTNTSSTKVGIKHRILKEVDNKIA